MKQTKRLLILCLTFLGCFTGMWADDISEQQAQQIAAEAFGQLHRSSPVGAKATARAKEQVRPVLAYTMQKEGQPADLYVFNSSADGNDGFVIVAGDDNAASIVGYSEQGHFDGTDIPLNLKALLEQYAEEISYLRHHPKEIQKSSTANSKKIEMYYGNIVVGPLVKSTWNQGSPYSRMTPNQTFTGCTITATTQIMNYWQCPKQGRGRHTYTNPAHKEEVYSATFEGVAYDWDNMLDSYLDGYTDEQGDAVARLMVDVGISCNAAYGDLGGTGASEEYAAYALQKYFGYKSSWKKVWRPQVPYVEMTDDPEWDQMLRNELDAGRPILYTGFPRDEDHVTGMFPVGHAFVCSGYTDKGYFHFNFGWSGSHDGWFLTSLIGDNSMDFTIYQTAVIGIEPAEEGTQGVVDGVFYEIMNDSEAQVIGFDEVDAAHVDIKESINLNGKQYKVTTLNPYVFSIVETPFSVTLPETIKEIDTRTFAGTGLTEITLPTTLKEIGKDAFRNSNLSGDINLPSSLVSVGEYAFSGTKIDRIVFPPSVSEVPAYVCYDCPNLQTVGISEGIDKIGESAFEDCPKIFQVSSWASEIGKKAFCGTKELYTYNFSQVRKIGDAAFAGCPFNNLKFEVLEEAGNSIFWAGCTPDVYIGANVTVPNLNWLPWEMKTLTVSPDNLLYFDCNNTVYDHDMTTIYYCGLNATNVYEGTDNFSHLHLVQVDSDYPRTELVIPETVTRIAPRSLHVNSNCKLVIPASVTEMSENNIYHREVYNYATTPQEIDDRSVAVQGTLHVPAGCKEAYAAAVGWRDYETIVDDLPATGEEPATHEPVNGVYVITRHWWNQFVIKNSPVLYFEIPFSEHPTIIYEASGSFTVTADNGVSYYKRTDKVTDESYNIGQWGGQDGMVKLSFFNDGTADGIKNMNAEKMDSQINVNGRNISVNGLRSGTAVVLYALDGRILAKGQASSNGQSVVSLPGNTSAGVYILKVGNTSVKINAK